GNFAGEGYHYKAGTDHAEVVALKAAGDKARGGTLYVTLEPCNHIGRTPACTEAILAAGIRSVHIAMADPNPHVKGGGIERLRAAGLDVTVGDSEKEARTLNRAFIHWSETERPWVHLKAAVSLDGKIATKTGESRYISHPAALSFVHDLRRQHDAILVGVQTVLMDDPALTYRGTPPGRDPVRIVLDSHGRTPPSARIFQSGSLAPTLIVTTSHASLTWERDIFSAGGEVLRVPADESGRVALLPMLQQLGERHILSVLVEGGAHVHGSFIDADLADQITMIYAPIIIGGLAPSAIAGQGIAHLADSVRFAVESIATYGTDVCISAQRIQSSLKEDTPCLPDSSKR
ncbi:MAG: bifunctional diaminohydroxyphosphoribosylaminopyrimidine deaminase/5-amino-6-(5-phosphoribosylamino)uracil reductase RibD, partial [Firmicutes bacterium]|nr:bifunctional diaminohydroxyphosphoribosylaminopyrimidine deaminase/5-amino-6-(5-phosphoribosylamino)uracil reductase RibD [Bacillota bacterium]